MVTSDDVELFEDELDLLINKAHKVMNYWEILKAVLNRCLSLMMQAEAEYRVKGG